MKIKQITSRNRRDFTAIYECEHCKHENKAYGYDDSYFHNHVIPSMECDNCGKSSDKDYKPMHPKYPDSATI